MALRALSSSNESFVGFTLSTSSFDSVWQDWFGEVFSDLLSSSSLSLEEEASLESELLLLEDSEELFF